MTTIFVTGGSGYLGIPRLRELVARGFPVRAMARSTVAADRIQETGATAVSCDLSSEDGLVEAVSGCEWAIHAAGRFRQGGGYPMYHRDNVEGTRTLLAAARRAGVSRLVYVGAAGCLIGHKRVVDADESWPLQELSYSPYFRSKTLAEREVLAASREGFVTCVVRPGLIWGGKSDPQLDEIAAAAQSGKLMLIDGGRHPMVTSHVENTIEGIICALARGQPRQAYFVFDDGTVTLRDFFTQLLATRGRAAPRRAIPYPVAWIAANVLEAAWALLRRSGTPPINRELVKLNGGPFIVSDRKARLELGYKPPVSFEQGIERLVGTRSPVAAPPRADEGRT